MWHGGSKSVDVRFFAFLFRHFLQLIWFKILVTEYKDLFLNELRLVSLEQSWQVRKGNKKFQNICVIMSSKQLPTTITRLFCNFAGQSRTMFCFKWTKQHQNRVTTLQTMTTSEMLNWTISKSKPCLAYLASSASRKQQTMYFEPLHPIICSQSYQK